MTRITQICADFYFIDNEINTFFIFCIIGENPRNLRSFRIYLFRFSSMRMLAKIPFLYTCALRIYVLFFDFKFDVHSQDFCHFSQYFQ